MNEQRFRRFAVAAGLAIEGLAVDAQFLGPTAAQQPETPPAVAVPGAGTEHTLPAVDDRLCEQVTATNVLELHTNRLTGKSIVSLARGLETQDGNCQAWIHIQADERILFDGVIANPRENVGPWVCDPAQVVNHDRQMDCRADIYPGGGRIGMSALAVDAPEPGSFLMLYTTDGTTDYPTLLKVSQPVAWSYLPLAVESGIASAEHPAEPASVDIFTWKSDQAMRDQVYLPIAVVDAQMSGQTAP